MRDVSRHEITVMRVIALLLSLAFVVSCAERSNGAAQPTPPIQNGTTSVATQPASAAKVPVPKLQGHVNDYAGILTEQQRTDMEGRLTKYEKETAHQMVVLTVPTLGVEPIKSFSLRVANAWRLGRKDLDNGVLITVSLKDHQARIELGRGMSKYVSDAVAAEIMDSVIVPQFRTGNYARGIELGVERLTMECRAYKVRP
jgi:uncharacterized protein